MAKKGVGAEVKLTLGEYLASIRVDRGITLREVERANGKSRVERVLKPNRE